MLLALGAFGGLLGVASFLIAHDSQTAAGYAARFLLGLGRQDSWRPMIMAIQELRANPDIPIYSKLFFVEHAKFQYPISSLLFVDLLQRATGLGWPAVIKILNWLSWPCVWATGLVAWRLLVDGIRRTDMRDLGSLGDRALLLAGCLATAVSFYPLTRSYTLGQIQTSMTFFAALSLLLWSWDRKRAAGVLIGMCCALKPQWGLILLWAAIRREWSMVAAGAATFVVLAVGAGALYGFGHYLDYMPVLSYLSHHGESFFPNQSVNGLMNRLLFNGNNIQWLSKTFPDFNPTVYAATLAAAAAFLIPALLFRKAERPGALDLALVMLATTMASPIAWEHHYGILLPIFALLTPICLSERPFGRFTGACLIVAFVLASQRYNAPNLLADTYLNVLQSYLFFAALLVLAALYRILPAAGAPAPTTTARFGFTRVAGGT